MLHPLTCMISVATSLSIWTFLTWFLQSSQHDTETGRAVVPLLSSLYCQSLKRTVISSQLAQHNRAGNFGYIGLIMKPLTNVNDDLWLQHCQCVHAIYAAVICVGGLGSVSYIRSISPVLSGVLCEFKYALSNSLFLSEDLSPRTMPQDYLAWWLLVVPSPPGRTTAPVSTVLPAPM
jgi:hypothetical protein